MVRLQQFFIIIIFVSSRNALSRIFSCSYEGYVCYFIDVQCDEVLNSGRTITPIEFQV